MLVVGQFVVAVVRAVFWTVCAFPRTTIAVLFLWWLATKGQGL